MAGRLRLKDLYARWLRRRFYNRLFLLNAAIFIAVVFCFCASAAAYVTKTDTDSNMRRNREALAAVCDEYDRKHNNFYNIILPLYTSTENAGTLTQLLEGDAALTLDAMFKARVVEMLRWLTVQDGDITDIFVYRSADGAGYIYNERGRSFERVPLNYPFFEELKAKPEYGRAIYGVHTLGSGSQARQVYGIAGTIGTRDVYNGAGCVMVAYNVSALRRAYLRNAAEASGRYLIVSADGEVIFDSDGSLYGRPFGRMDLAAANGKTADYDGVKSIVQVIDHSNRNYYGICVESAASAGMRTARNRLLIYLAGTGISLLSALLYLLSGFLATRRVAALERAMALVGSNNLDYRLPVRGRGDEFEHIAVGFNRMCDELQDNINKLYVNEIKQKSAELSALQSGINPHFLYNTLEAICSKAREDGSDDVAELIVRMASLLRNLVHSQTFIPVRQELDFCRMYLGMFTLRYADRFDYSIDVEPAALGYGVPKGMLQPVLENYFVHGIREDTEDNMLTITGIAEGGFVSFTIADNGKGIEPGRLEELRDRLERLDTSRAYGLANVNERIQLVFGRESGLAIESGERGTAVTVRVRAMSCAELERSIRSPLSEKES